MGCVVKAEEGEAPISVGVGRTFCSGQDGVPLLRTQQGKWRWRGGARHPRHRPVDSRSSPHLAWRTHCLTSPGRESTGEITNNTVPFENMGSGNCCSALFKNLVRASGERWGGGSGP